MGPQFAAADAAACTPLGAQCRSTTAWSTAPTVAPEAQLICDAESDVVTWWRRSAPARAADARI
jgi:hypothetical protein